MIELRTRVRSWGLILFVLMLNGCETASNSRMLEKSARSEELQKETVTGVELPAGCPTLTASIPAGKTGVTVSYREPSTNQDGTPLTDLAYTTIYLKPSTGAPQAIRVWTNDARGGGTVSIHDVSPGSQEFGVCITATTLGKKESGPGLVGQ